MKGKVILLVEDNPDDEVLTLRALRNNVTDEVVVARDGVEALDYLFATGEHAGGGTSGTPRRALRNNLTDEVVVARDGVEALDYLFATGEHAGRDTSVMPQLILLDLKL